MILKKNFRFNKMSGGGVAEQAWRAYFQERNGATEENAVQIMQGLTCCMLHSSGIQVASETNSEQLNEK